MRSPVNAAGTSSHWRMYRVSVRTSQTRIGDAAVSIVCCENGIDREVAGGESIFHKAMLYGGSLEQGGRRAE